MLFNISVEFVNNSFFLKLQEDFLIDKVVFRLDIDMQEGK